MKALIAFLRIPPVLTALVISLALPVLWLAWPKDLLSARTVGLGLAALLGVIWLAVDIVRFYLDRSRLQTQPRGQLRARLEDAYKALVKRCQVNGGLSGDGGALALPWIIAVGPRKSGKTQALQQSDFELIHECRTELREEDAVCSVWLSRVYGGANGRERSRIVIWEISRTFHEGDSAREILDWLATRRKQLAAALVMIGADELGNGDADGARRSARYLSDILSYAGRSSLHELPTYIVLNKSDLIDGFNAFFHRDNADERETFGFSVERGIADGLASLLRVLNGLVASRLAAARGLGDCESVLAFPPEVGRYGSLLSSFVQELVLQVKFVRIREVYWTSAGAKGEPILSSRRKQLPGQIPAQSAARTSLPRFLEGMFERLAQMGYPGAPPGGVRWVVLLANGALTIGIIAAMGYFALSRYSRLEAVQNQLLSENQGTLRGAYVQLMLLDSGNGKHLIPSLNREERATGLRLQLDQDRLVDQRLGDVLGRLKALGWDGKQTQALEEAVSRLRHCRSATRFVLPMLLYAEANKNRYSQPLYEDLARLSQSGQDRGSLRRGFEVLKVAALLNPDGKCRPPTDYVKWIARYYTQLWLKEKSQDVALAKDLENYLQRFFAEYWRTPGGRMYPRLRLDESQYNDHILERIRAKFSARPGAGDASIIWTLILLEALPGADAQTFLAGQGLPLHSRTTVPSEFTALGCRDITKFYEKGPKDQGSPEVAWLPCALRMDVPENPLGEGDLWRYYQQEHVKAWQSWIDQLEIQRPPTLEAAVRLLQALPVRLDRLLARVGLGEQGEEKDLVNPDCRATLRPYLPFRWAVPGADGAQAPDVGNAYALYRQRIVEVQARLAQLSQAAAPKDASELQSSLNLLTGLEERRRALVDALRTGGPDIGPRLKVDKLDEALAWLEDGLWEIVTQHVQRAIVAQWQTVTTAWDGLRVQPVADAAAAAAIQQQITTLLNGFRAGYVAPFANVQTCKPESYGNGVPQRRSVLCTTACQELNSKIVAAGRAWQPRPAETPLQIGTAPTMVGAPTSSCGTSSVARVRLDTKELQVKYICYLYQRGECRSEGPSDGGKATLEISWRGQERFEQPGAASRDTFRRLVLDHLPKDRDQNPRLPDLEEDPQTYQKRVPVLIPVEGCPSMKLKLFLDQALVQSFLRGHSKPGGPQWLEPTFLQPNLMSCPAQSRPERVR